MFMEREDTFYSDTADQVKVELTHDEQLALATEYKRVMSHDLMTKTDVLMMLQLAKGILDQTFYKKD